MMSLADREHPAGVVLRTVFLTCDSETVSQAEIDLLEPVKASYEDFIYDARVIPVQKIYLGLFKHGMIIFLVFDS